MTSLIRIIYLRSVGTSLLNHSPFSVIFNINDISIGRLACKLFDHLRKEAAAVKIQKNIRRYESRKAYKELNVSVLILQTAIRAAAARKKFRFKKQTKASVIIQVFVKYYMIWIIL